MVEQNSRVTREGEEPMLCDLRPLYTNREMDHLRLLHHYSNFTVESFAATFQLEDRACRSLRLDIPQLAFQNHFLLDAIFSVALLHLSSTDESTKDGLPQLALYRDQAFRRLRIELMRSSQVSMVERPNDRFRAVVATSILLAVTALAADRFSGDNGIWLTNYLALSIGPRTILPRRRTTLSVPSSAGRGRGDKRTSDKDSDFSHICPVTIVPDLELVQMGIDESDEDWGHIDDLRRAVKGIKWLFGALFCSECDVFSRISDNERQPCIAYKVRIWPFAFVTSGFVDMARKKRPRALVVMAYYLAFFPWLLQTWLYRDVGPADMYKLTEAVGPTWQSCLAAPKVAVLVKDLDLLTPFLSELATCQGAGDEPHHEGFFDGIA
ncbi:fungal Zn binuclear cluster domain-containing protein [Colletotrichum filicis]|nr:fungal Zn binuclear cluster domain-containing protein [Colletotrichum filicis]